MCDSRTLAAIKVLQASLLNLMELLQVHMAQCLTNAHQALLVTTSHNKVLTCSSAVLCSSCLSFYGLFSSAFMKESLGCLHCRSHLQRVTVYTSLGYEVDWHIESRHLSLSGLTYAKP